MDRLNRSLELEASRRAQGAGSLKQPLRLLDCRPVPEFDRLVAQRNITPKASRRASRREWA